MTPSEVFTDIAGRLGMDVAKDRPCHRLLVQGKYAYHLFMRDGDGRDHSNTVRREDWRSERAWAAENGLTLRSLIVVSHAERSDSDVFWQEDYAKLTDDCGHPTVSDHLSGEAEYWCKVVL